MTVILIVIAAFGVVTKGFVPALVDFEITGQVGTIQTIALLRSARIMKRILETWGYLLSINPL